MRKVMLPALVLATAAYAGPLQAQSSCGNAAASPGPATCSFNGSVSVTVPYIVRLAVDADDVVLTAPDETDFTTGGTVQIVDANLQQFTVRANAAWSLSVTGAAWTAPYAKAIADLEVSSDGTTYVPLAVTAVEVETGTATASTLVDLSYRTDWDLTADIPGDYSMALTFTIAAP